MAYPVLYSFYRCPYAMRARLALLRSKKSYYLREVNLKEKPADMLVYSPKGTVPVMLLADGQIIDESLDIVDWAFAQEQDYQKTEAEEQLIKNFQQEFVYYVYRWKYPERYNDVSKQEAGKQIQNYLRNIAKELAGKGYLYNDIFGKAEVVILPFIRQAYLADQEILVDKNLDNVKSWLEQRLATDEFKTAMLKYDIWSEALANQKLISL